MKTYFATQIYHQKLPFDIADLELEIQQIKSADKAGILWSKNNYKKGYTSYGSLDKLHKLSSTFEKLQRKIDQQATQFLKKLDYSAMIKKDLIMTDCWVNIMPAGAQHTGHIHPHSVLSGTYYVRTPDQSSAIKFEDPRLGLFMNAPLVKLKAKANNLRFVSIQPKGQDLILFESWLKHEVPINTSKEPRISISFNYGWV